MNQSTLLEEVTGARTLGQPILLRCGARKSVRKSGGCGAKAKLETFEASLRSPYFTLSPQNQLLPYFHFCTCIVHSHPRTTFCLTFKLSLFCSPHSRSLYNPPERGIQYGMARHTLPPSEQELLRGLRSSLPALRYRVLLLRSQGWTLRAIGEPLSAPRSTVRAWEHASLPLDAPPASYPSSLPPPPPPPDVRPAPTSSAHSHPHPPRVRALAPNVPAADALRIQALAPLARKVRGGTPASSPLRHAKRELDDLVLHHVRRGVPVQRLATLAGVSYRAMKVRVDAHAAPAAS